jgi:hypothetical protein
MRNAQWRPRESPARYVNVATSVTGLRPEPGAIAHAEREIVAMGDNGASSA